MKMIAFLDESFDSFFDLKKNDGYFCMGIFILPESKLREFSKVFKEYKEKLENLLQRPAHQRRKELKSSALRNLTIQQRNEAAKNLLDWAITNDAYVGGFYTSTKGFCNFTLRDSKATDQQISEELYTDENIKAARLDILAQRKSAVAESYMIGQIAQTVAGILLGFCGNSGHTFSIRYDPRNEQEDHIVFGEIVKRTMQVEKVMHQRKVYLGYSNTLTSSQCEGLQMVDFVTKDLKSMFKEHPRLLTDFNSRQLITPEINTTRHTVTTEVAGRKHKWGDLEHMDSSLVTSLFAPNSPFSLLNYHEIIMSKFVSCYSDHGTARIIDLNDFVFQDMVD
ncbi:DUF3800 domain-containing protein [Rubritalea spongiae]|uniref:DUF3800 domain-containing protein n=1 Tax=Rubritalea spongiae TaxID=430797 RepID=A0ABW5E3K3_9BACT